MRRWIEGLVGDYRVELRQACNNHSFCDDIGALNRGSHVEFACHLVGKGRTVGVRWMPWQKLGDKDFWLLQVTKPYSGKEDIKGVGWSSCRKKPQKAYAFYDKNENFEAFPGAKELSVTPQTRQ